MENKAYYVTMELRVRVKAHTPTQAGIKIAKAMAGFGVSLHAEDGFMDDVEVAGSDIVDITEET